MPRVLRQADADVYRYVHGGPFPRWRSEGVANRILRYAEMLEADKDYNDKNTRAALDRMADRLIGDAQDFIEETIRDVLTIPTEHGVKIPENRPGPVIVLIRRRWSENGHYDKARRALTSAHFEHRLTRAQTGREAFRNDLHREKYQSIPRQSSYE